MTKAEEFAKLNGIEKISCLALNSGETIYLYPSEFRDAKSILEVMEKRNDFGNFLHTKVGHITTPTRNEQYAYVEIYYVYNPDKLLDEAIKFCKENKV